MEIPYIVEPRKDTGLFNSKIAIWLFLASEVMLFGGLFSAYIFLRLGADFPWPERALPIVPGLINTAILIASSVTVVFAWAELKLRNWRKFQIYMSITLLCAVAFMCIKIPFEYAAKFAHQAVRMDDFVTLEGHVLKPKEKDGKLVHEHSLGNYLRVAPDTLKTYKEGEEVATATGFNVSVSVSGSYDKYITNILEQAEKAKMKTSLYLGDNKNSFIEIDGKKYNADTPLSIDVLNVFKEHFIDFRTNNNSLNTRYLAQAWNIFEEELDEGKHPALEGKPAATQITEVTKIQNKLIAASKKREEYINVKLEGWDKDRVELGQKMTFYVYAEEDAYLKFVPASGNFGGGANYSHTAETDKTVVTILHRDGMTVIGEESDKALSGIELAVDQIDVRHFLMRWEQDDSHQKPSKAMYLGEVVDGKYLSPEQVRQNFIDKYKDEDPEKLKSLPVTTDHLSIFKDDNLAIKHYPAGSKDLEKLEKRIANKVTLRKIWETHMKWAAYRDAELKDKGGITELEEYVVTWKHMVGYKNAKYKMDSQEDYETYKNEHELSWASGFTGANHDDENHESAFPYVWIPRKDIKLESNLTPKWNNYYAIYFTITGLHGLHVIGGALVLAYYLFFGKKMFDSNPEWLANRVEVGGLFWHFVDLVWIFAFPIFYLM